MDCQMLNIYKHTIDLFNIWLPPYLADNEFLKNVDLKCMIYYTSFEWTTLKYLICCAWHSFKVLSNGKLTYTIQAKIIRMYSKTIFESDVNMKIFYLKSKGGPFKILQLPRRFVLTENPQISEDKYKG